MAAETREARTTGWVVVETLRNYGVDTVFGLDGSHVIQVFDALADAPSIAPLTFKHENNAAIAAEMYGRLTGRPGVVLVTAGPGATRGTGGGSPGTTGIGAIGIGGTGPGSPIGTGPARVVRSAAAGPQGTAPAAPTTPAGAPPSPDV